MVKLSNENRLSVLYPEIAKEWHSTKNETLKPEDVSTGSNKKVWWQCPKNNKHAWEAKISSRTNLKTGCPFCSGRLTTPEDSFKVTHSHIAKEWHPTKNGVLKPEQFRYASHKKVWWLCPEGHEYPTIISHRTVSGTACPYCANHFVCLDNCLATVMPDLAKEWHPEKNKKLTPFDVTPGMERKVWWKCEQNHEWEEKLKHRKRGVSCPHCLEEKIKLDNRMIALFPELAKEWHPTKNGDLKVEEITFGMRAKIWWKCEKGHEYPSKVSSRTKGRSGCPYCAGHKPTKENNLGVLFPELIKEWHPTKNKDLTPFHVLTKSKKVMWWKCKDGHDYTMEIVQKTKGLICPDCKEELKNKEK
ncbi:hypothetical protein CVD28_02800 [Bacillus sp. M6-12]|uniref:zinc-ribbon domain-containing protein n=1 Tax=Bacillus sp. M6-12 TaxID=2054166 RepID=UPI000C78A717|nr:zinc-ribbon domain-containing protein [Bacillus sp. M6-12]PLS19361.1 hypothetical protein CVD28_02800 [Bacillus sp. M6-12]